MGKKAYIGITDGSWFNTIKQHQCTEVNFWKPGAQGFAALNEGELFLFKMHAPERYITGCGFFQHFARFRISQVWDAYGVGNGAHSLQELRQRIGRYRQGGAGNEDFIVGCILLTNIIFFPEQFYIPEPRGWSSNIVTGKTYDLEENAELFDAIHRAIAATPAQNLPHAAEPHLRYGNVIPVRPRLGQGTFRMVVLDKYQRRCALTGERVEPVLEAAHVRPYSQEGSHSMSNGILLKSDLHKLFDRGYLTITPDRHIEVSQKIHEEFENGRDYYELHGRVMRNPINPRINSVSEENLLWHNENIYRG